MSQSLYHTCQRYRTLRTHRITSLPILILMPHSACNCRCVMCDIWKGNKHLKQLQEAEFLLLDMEVGGPDLDCQRISGVIEHGRQPLGD